MIKLLVVIDAAVAVICWILYVLLVISANNILKKMHLDGYSKKSFWADFAYVMIKFTILTLCPVINICIFCALLTQFENIRDKVVQDIELRRVQKEKE